MSLTDNDFSHMTSNVSPISNDEPIYYSTMVTTYTLGYIYSNIDDEVGMITIKGEFSNDIVRTNNPTDSFKYLRMYKDSIKNVR